MKRHENEAGNRTGEGILWPGKGDGDDGDRGTWIIRTMVPPNDPSAAGGNVERPINMPTMNRERPYPLGLTRIESDRRRQRSLSKAAEFSRAPVQEDELTREREEDRDPRRQSWLTRNESDPKLQYYPPTGDNELEDERLSSKRLDDPFMIKISEGVRSPPTSTFEGMGLIVYQPKSGSSRHLTDQLRNPTSEGVRSPTTSRRMNPLPPTQRDSQQPQLVFDSDSFTGLTPTAEFGGRDQLVNVNQPQPETSVASSSDIFSQDITVQSSPEVQPNNQPNSNEETPRDDHSSSSDSDGYIPSMRYRRRSSLAVGPQEESHLLREWHRKKREELEEKPRKSEEKRRQILDIAKNEMNSFYVKRSAGIQSRKIINREKEREYDAGHKTGKDSKMPLNLWEVVVSMLPPAPPPERLTSSGNRTPSTTSATPQTLLTPSTFFSQHTSTVPPATPPKQGSVNAKRGKDVNKKDASSTTTGEEVEGTPQIKETDKSRMRQILIKLKSKPPDIFNKHLEIP